MNPSVICLPSVTQYVPASMMLDIPSVAMKESTFSRTTTKPLTAPMRAPHSSVVSIATVALIPRDS